MTDETPWIEPDFGKRLAAWRRHRGFRTTAALAERVAELGGNVSASVLQNYESGRKSDPPVSQLLALSHALQVPPVALLTPLGDPHAFVETPGSEMAPRRVFEFDAWWSVTDAEMDPLFDEESHPTREVVRWTRTAVRAIAEIYAWRERQQVAADAGDDKAEATAARGLATALTTLFAAVGELQQRGAPTRWAKLDEWTPLALTLPEERRGTTADADQ